VFSRFTLALKGGTLTNGLIKLSDVLLMRMRWGGGAKQLKGGYGKPPDRKAPGDGLGVGLRPVGVQ